MFEYSGKTYEYKDKSFVTNWKITSIPDLVLWLEPSKKNILSDDGGRIHTWRDISGKANHATQNTQTKKPYVTDPTFNGYNYVYFDDNKTLEVDLYVDYFTIFVVNNSNDNQYIYQFGDTGSTSGFYLNGDLNSISVKSGSTISTKSAGYVWNQGKGWRTLVHYYSGTHSSNILRINNASIFLDNYLNYTGSPGHIGIKQKLYIGGQSSGNGFNGGIAEFILFNRKIENYERDLVQNYINTKYNL